MPTYDYECSKCGITFEHFQSIKDEPLKTCIHPEGCQHPDSESKVIRQIGIGAGIIFKGSGFYATDYRSKEYRDSAKREGSLKSVPVSSSSPSNGNGNGTSPSPATSSTASPSASSAASTTASSTASAASAKTD